MRLQSQLLLKHLKKSDGQQLGCKSISKKVLRYVEAPDKSSGKRKQKIPISYDLIGFIPVDVLTKAEQA